MLAILERGDMLEVGIVGREGMVGLPVILGGDSSITEPMAQIPGGGWYVWAATVKQAFDTSPAVRSLFLRYVLAYHNQVTQTAACYGRHPLEERLARWLLMVHDRVDGDELLLTQELIAQMLGVRRPGVTVAAGILQKVGVISYKQGCITVLDRLGLEDASCECYRTIRQQFEQLLG